MSSNVKNRIKVMEGDITEMDTDAIVNAANNELKLGAGVAGAIRKKGGPSIQEECDRTGAIDVGGAALTKGGDLKAPYVIHAASMSLGGKTTEPNLRSSVKESLCIADREGLKSVSFPAIGTGVAGFPMDKAAAVMLEEVKDHLEKGGGLQEVRFVLFGEDAFNAFQKENDKL